MSRTRSYLTHLRKWYDHATQEQRIAGQQWYQVAYAESQRIAASHNTDVATVVGMIAALSPRISWEENLKGADALLRNRRASVAGFRVNREKALRIKAGSPASDVLGGQKVTSFYRNILGDTNAVTVDTWAARAAGMSEREATQLHRRGRYERVANAYRKLAHEKGIAPHEAQATVWLAIRSSDTV